MRHRQWQGRQWHQKKQRQQWQCLPQFVMQLARDPGPLLLTNRLQSRRERAELLARLCDLLSRQVAVGDVTLNAEMSGDPALPVVDAEVMAFDANRSAVHAPLVGLDVDMPRIEHRAPPLLPALDVVREELRRCFPDHVLEQSPVLPGVGLVRDRHPLVSKDIVEQCLLTLV